MRVTRGSCASGRCGRVIADNPHAAAGIWFGKDSSKRYVMEMTFTVAGCDVSIVGYKTVYVLEPSATYTFASGGTSVSNNSAAVGD